jgi:two-component system sensor histidine kinase KdpD
MPEDGARGKLKVYLGYAAGVGKTYAMLVEAQDLKRQGVDVVVGYFEPHGRKATIALMTGLEATPRRKIEYRGTVFEEMDTDAILRRHPRVCAVDEFPHTNVPGAERHKRWEDVQVLLDDGINVITTMNVQHLESLNDHVREITGVCVRETIPDWVVKQADEVVMIDLPPQALLNRLKRGVVYGPEKAGQALQNFFKESTLVVLRELALRQTAHEVDLRQVSHYELEPSWAEAHSGANTTTVIGKPVADKILIYITAEASSATLIRRGRRVADYLQADCFAVAIVPRSSKHVHLPERELLERHLNFARNLHIETRLLQGDRPAETLVEFARMHQITQIYLARPAKKPLFPSVKGSFVQQVVRMAHDMQVTIIAGTRVLGRGEAERPRARQKTDLEPVHSEIPR